MKQKLTTILALVSLAVSGVSLALAPLAYAGTPPPAATVAQSNNAVNIQNFAFSPITLSVGQGETVTWTNNDSTAHTVTADSGNGPQSGQIMPGQTYSFTFNTPGTFGYHCSIHPQMQAMITVIANGSTPAPVQPQPQPQPQPESTMPGMGGGTVATGPVAAGGGSTAASYRDDALSLGTLALLAAAALLLGRRELADRE